MRRRRWLVACAAAPLAMDQAFGAPTLLDRVLAAAHAQIGVTTLYDGTYRRIGFPGGDVPVERGVCTDVLIRAYRTVGLDLQALVHEDMKRAFAAYPKLWGLTRPDPHIDHRRVPNLATFWSRRGAQRTVSARARDHAAGDIVIWRLPTGVPHVGFVSDRSSSDGARPLIVHNVGSGVQVEDVLFAWQHTGRYRWSEGRGV